MKIQNTLAILLAGLTLGVTVAAKDHTGEYRDARLLDRNYVATGSSCTTAPLLLGMASTDCGGRGTMLYKLLANDTVFIVRPLRLDDLVNTRDEATIKFRPMGHGSTPTWMMVPDERGHEIEYIIVRAYAATETDISPRLTNQAVIDMVRNGQSPELVIAKIERMGRRCTFDTSDSGIQNLQASGVPDSVIAVMIAKH